MAGVYSEFLSSLNSYGVSKTSHFRLYIPLTFKDERFSDIDRLLGLRCEATELPGRQLVSNDSRTYGPSYKTPYQSLYQEITLNFIETANFMIRGFFETWMSNIFNPNTNILAYPDTYRVDTTLTQYSTSDVAPGFSVTSPKVQAEGLPEVARWYMNQSFPTAINQMPVSWAEDGLHRTTVTLAFEWYTLLTGLDTSLNPQPKLNSPPVSPKGSARQ
jgi:hypothetical protein